MYFILFESTIKRQAKNVFTKWIHVLFLVVLTLLTDIKIIYWPFIILFVSWIALLSVLRVRHTLSAPPAAQTLLLQTVQLLERRVCEFGEEMWPAQRLCRRLGRERLLWVQKHISDVYMWADLRSLRGLFVSCSRLYSVSLDVLESVQCVVWSGVSLPPEEHPERRAAGGVLRRRTVRQPRVFPAGLSWYRLNTHNAFNITW